MDAHRARAGWRDQAPGLDFSLRGDTLVGPAGLAITGVTRRTLEKYGYAAPGGRIRDAAPLVESLGRTRSPLCCLRGTLEGVGERLLRRRDGLTPCTGATVCNLQDTGVIDSLATASSRGSRPCSNQPYVIHRKILHARSSYSGPAPPSTPLLELFGLPRRCECPVAARALLRQWRWPPLQWAAHPPVCGRHPQSRSVPRRLLPR